MTLGVVWTASSSRWENQHNSLLLTSFAQKYLLTWRNSPNRRTLPLTTLSLTSDLPCLFLWGSFISPFDRLLRLQRNWRLCYVRFEPYIYLNLRNIRGEGSPHSLLYLPSNPTPPPDRVFVLCPEGDLHRPIPTLSSSQTRYFHCLMQYSY